ncbi:tRNA lysidine(34) synthetase TilS [uncultured Bifidobacterium sp.]|uniref:tRNA lysidine(34) synthetase TilS n=1 Tax=uncultured Bifidobacterium sp. TaxID=165187 RepID=UPI0028DB53E4|nr:tRNA lysidine(34) synthetase TilS [uncultured Bifidobacterium sp.]
MKAAVGAVRASLAMIGIARQGDVFRSHGEHRPAADAPLVLVACSGGRDSLALAATAATVCASLGVRCGAVVIDHRLQRGSETVAAEAAGRCRHLGLDPVLIRRVDVVDVGGGVEDAARSARYHALSRSAREERAVAVLLAHTRNDQAETVLLGLLRSGGLESMAGMPRSTSVEGVVFLRPLLGLRRSQTTAICRDLGLGWWDDPTNGDAAAVHGGLDRNYPLRSRIRHALIPFLDRLTGSDVTGVLSRQAERYAMDADCLNRLSDEAAGRLIEVYRDLHSARPEARVDADGLAAEHRAIRTRVILRALATVGVTAAERHVLAIEALAVDWHGQGAVALPGGRSAFRQGHVIRLCQDGMHENR